MLPTFARFRQKEFYIEIKTVVLTYKVLHGLAPQCLCLLNRISGRRSLRSARRH